jgi:ABC-type Mn2+/Zn2+ transport system permease subunit
MFPGLVVAALSGAPLLLGAAAGVLAAAAGVALAGRDRRVGGDAAVAVVVTALLGLGALLALSPRTPARCFRFRTGGSARQLRFPRKFDIAKPSRLKDLG